MEAQQHQQRLRFLPPFVLPPVQGHCCSQLLPLMAPKWLPLLWGHLHTQHPAAEKGMFPYIFVFIRTLSCLPLATHPPTFPQVSMPDFTA